jgi:hypothetical protein
MNCPDARNNFNNLYWSFITVFQVVTIENFPDVMETAQRSTGLAAPLYFITLIMIGTFILCNLVVAILLEGFEERAREEEEGIRLASHGAHKNKVLIIAHMSIYGNNH